CGFCTSGLLMAGKALLDEEPAPTAERVAAYLRGNLCRCTGYRRVVDAMTHGKPAGADTSAPGSQNVVGRSVRRIDAIEKVTGRARCGTDLGARGMPPAKLPRPPYPQARSAGSGPGRARGVPGVGAVVTSADLGWCDPSFGPASRDGPILAVDVARYEGEP